MSSPGGGGYGNPLRRKAELVQRDVKDNVVSPEAAKKTYGVVLDDNFSIDHDKTDLMRK